MLSTKLYEEQKACEKARRQEQVKRMSTSWDDMTEGLLRPVRREEEKSPC